MARATLAHLLHDVGLAAWFGGTLANAVALNEASSNADTAASTGAVTNEGWDRWTPVNAAAIGVHLAGATALLKNDYGRLKAQAASEQFRPEEVTRGVVSRIVG